MAYLPSLVDEEQDNPEQSRGGAISGSSTAGRPSRAPSRTPFTNVQDYISANQPSLGQFSNQIAGGVQGAVDTARGEAKDIENEFGSKAGTPGGYNDILGLIQGGNAGNLTGAQKDIAKKYISGPGYQGYGSLTDVGGYEKQAGDREKALQLLSLAQSGEGTGALIKNVAKPENYTQGLQSFDTALLNAEPGSRQKIAGVAEQNKGFSGELAAAGERTKTLGESAKSQFGSGKTQLTTAANIALDNIRKANENQVKTGQEAAYKKYKEDAYKQAGDYTQSKYGQDLYHSGVDIGQYLPATSPNDFYSKSAMTPEQQSSYGALSDILGVSPDLNVEAGGRELSPFNYGGFQSAVDTLHNPARPDFSGVPQPPVDYSIGGDAQKTKDALDFIKQQQDDVQEYGPFTGRPMVDEYYKYKLAKNKLGM